MTHQHVSDQRIDTLFLKPGRELVPQHLRRSLPAQSRSLRNVHELDANAALAEHADRSPKTLRQPTPCRSGGGFFGRRVVFGDPAGEFTLQCGCRRQIERHTRVSPCPPPEDGTVASFTEVDTQNVGENRDERDVTLVACFHLPPERRLVPHTEKTSRQVEIVRQEQVAEFTRSQPRQEKCQVDRELPHVARFQQRPLLVWGQQHDGSRCLDGYAIDLNDRERVLGIRRKMSSSSRVVEHRPAALQHELQTLVQEWAFRGIRMSVG